MNEAGFQPMRFVREQPDAQKRADVLVIIWSNNKGATEKRIEYWLMPEHHKARIKEKILIMYTSYIQQ